MDLRQFFTSQTWWGKLIGAFFGFLMAGPAGALFGILIGNFFDRGLAEHLSKPFWHYHAEKNKAVKAVFFKAMFSIMGHLAKADGRVSELAIQMANTLMQDMELTTRQAKSAQSFFNEGKKADFKLQPVLVLLQKATRNNPPLLKLFIDTQYRVLQLDGLSENKLQIMNTILNYMQLAPLHQQHRFSDDFTGYSSFHHQYSSSPNQEPLYASPQNAQDLAYALLEIKPTANKQDVKRAYRRQMSRNHPDKLIAQGLSESRIKIANEKTQQIRKAYEQICNSRGW